MSILSRQDPEIACAIEMEAARQRNKIELIASENFVSPAVLEAQGSESGHGDKRIQRRALSSDCLRE